MARLIVDAWMADAIRDVFVAGDGRRADGRPLTCRILAARFGVSHDSVRRALKGWRAMPRRLRAVERFREASDLFEWARRRRRSVAQSGFDPRERLKDLKLA